MTAGWIEARLGQLENRLEYMIRWMQDIVQQVRGAQQNANQAQSTYQAPSGGSGGAGAFYAESSSGSWGATGTWPSLTPGSITATVYQASGTSLTSIGSKTIYNWFPASPANSLVLEVAPDGSGAYVVVTQSCT